MAVNETLLEALRLEWTEAQVRQAHAEVFAALYDRQKKEVKIIGKGNESSSASAQVVVGRADFDEWLETTQARIREIESAASGTGTLHGNTEHVSFANRYIRT
jgi:hypothetical protein